MSTAQSGIFALGSPSHAYLEFDLQHGKDARALIKAMADVREPRTTIGGEFCGRIPAGAMEERGSGRDARRSHGVQSQSDRPGRVRDACNAARCGAVAVREFLRRRL